MGHINAGAKIHYDVKETLPGWFAISADKENSDLVFALSDHNGTQNQQQSGTFCVGFGFTGQLPNPKDHKAVVTALQTLQADTTVKGYLTHDWAHDPFAKGTWWCGSPGMATKYTRELQQPHGRVTMASSDWADGWRSFVDGAIEQGSRAAARVAKLLGEGSNDAESNASKRDSGHCSE
jgi:lysyl oxidase-like protein 2/3/4